MLGVTVPIHNRTAAPVGGVALLAEVEKKLAVPAPPVPAGNVMAAAGLIEPLAAALQPPVVLATLTLVYEVYVISLVEAVPPTPGSAV